MTDISGSNGVSDDSTKHYTPTTEEVSKSYVWFRDQAFTDEKLKAEFDRWLAEVKAQAIHDFVESAIKPEKIMEVAAAGYNESVREVMAQTWDRGYEAGLTDFASSMSTNPYRQEETE